MKIISSHVENNLLYSGTKLAQTPSQVGGNIMLDLDRSKERQRFYLLPGQGGRAARRKQKLALLWAIVVGVIASIAVAVAFYFMNNSPLDR